MPMIRKLLGITMSLIILSSACLPRRAEGASLAWMPAAHADEEAPAESLTDREREPNASAEEDETAEPQVPVETPIGESPSASDTQAPSGGGLPEEATATAPPDEGEPKDTPQPQPEETLAPPEEAPVETDAPEPDGGMDELGLCQERCTHCQARADPSATAVPCVCANLDQRPAGCVCDVPGEASPDSDGQPLLCACTCVDAVEQLDMMPLSVPYADGIIVFTFLELRSAIQGGQYSKIYLGYSDGTDGQTANHGNISFTAVSGILIPASLSTLVIDGTDPRNGKRVTLTDRSSAAAADTIYVGGANKMVTLQNVDVVGHNFYGILCNMGYANVTFQFLNVQYAGRQLTHNRGSNTQVVLTNCDIMIQDMPIGAAEEVAETSAVTVSGTTTIQRVSSVNAGATFSLFWLCTGNAANPYTLTISPGAVVDMRTTNYLVYTDNSAKTNLEVYGTLRFTSTGSNGSLVFNSMYLDKVNIYSGGALSVSHQHASYPSMIVNHLTVQGSLDIARNAATPACISVWSGGSVQFQSPRRVSLTNDNGPLIQSAAGTASLSITTQALNLWTAPSGGANRRLWNNLELEAFTVTGQLRSGAVAQVSVSGLQNNQGVALQASTLNNANFNLGSGSGAASRLIAGQYDLRIDPVYAGESKVTGTASGGAIQTVQEYAYAGNALGGLIQSVSGVAESGGRYQTGENQLRPLGAVDSRVYVLSVRDQLEAHTYSDLQNGLYFYSMPDTMVFESATLSGADQLLDREDPDWTIQVYDGRNSGSPWQVTATIAQPLRTQDGSTLANGLVFLHPNGAMTPLSASATLVGSKSAADPVIADVRWARDRGMHVYIPAFTGRANVPYSTQITWTLQTGP